MRLIDEIERLRQVELDSLRARLAATEAVIEAARELLREADYFGEIILVGKDGPRRDREPIHAAAKRSGRGSVTFSARALRDALAALAALDALTP